MTVKYHIYKGSKPSDETYTLEELKTLGLKGNDIICPENGTPVPYSIVSGGNIKGVQNLQYKEYLAGIILLTLVISGVIYYINQKEVSEKISKCNEQKRELLESKRAVEDEIEYLHQKDDSLNTLITAKSAMIDRLKSDVIHMNTSIESYEAKIDQARYDREQAAKIKCYMIQGPSCVEERSKKVNNLNALISRLESDKATIIGQRDEIEKIKIPSIEHEISKINKALEQERSKIKVINEKLLLIDNEIDQLNCNNKKRENSG
jgi:outer membrane murein-binding lipoprotein Lpp